LLKQILTSQTLSIEQNIMCIKDIKINLMVPLNLYPSLKPLAIFLLLINRQEYMKPVNSFEAREATKKVRKAVNQVPI